ncbi:MAG: dihydroorotate dehydrogenase electron transfer subunit [Oscillospiraceae bacterium]|jgi:dihydroorotate dehydrogenase electron transfer subunit
MLAKLIELRSVTERDTLYVFNCPELARAARPGQFVELKISDSLDPFLRRPLSIFDVEGDTFTLLVRTVGRGTEYMTRWEPGMEVDVLGPLGNGFFWTEKDETFVLIGGGIGLAPLNFLARQLLKQGKQVHLLFSPKRYSKLLEALSDPERMNVSFAENRTALPAAVKTILEKGVHRVFCCGPDGLMETVAGISVAMNIPCQLSMERHMACGIGICLGCAIAIRTEQGLTYKKACKDGPVFNAEEVSFHEEP